MLKKIGRFFFYLASWQERREIRKQANGVINTTLMLVAYRDARINHFVELDVQVPIILLTASDPLDAMHPPSSRGPTGSLF